MEHIARLLIVEIMKDPQKKEKLVNACFDQMVKELPKAITKEMIELMREGDLYEIIYDSLRPAIKARVNALIVELAKIKS